MIWLALRRRRGALIVLTTLVVLLAAAYLVAGFMTRALYPVEHLGECTHGQSGSLARCGLDYGEPAYHFLGFMHGLAAWLGLTPLLIGLFLAVPATARDYETGAVRWAFTQDVSRRRWLITTTSAALVPAVILSVVFQLGYQFWHAPYGAFYGQFGQIRGYELGPLTMPMLTVFMVVLGLFAAVASRRVTAAIATTVLGWYVVAFVLSFLRPRYLPPLTTEGGHAPSRADWRLETRVTDATGARVPLNEAYDRAERLRIADGGTNVDDYFDAAGLVRWAEYQPAERFWTFQLIEAGILLALTMLTFAGTWLLVRRRT
ncbi:hypothetical protein FHR81_004311 [Actinoalloteichus hoggarensis]|uniref:ABC-2 family transporter protein n=1 Tax=Actinoalloteichus hoggarensis TaxID=1470176 RepID=A0A221W9K8_9PSEU|nr:hypothetical protein [Actinoalloteichus hoggarensis]ASO22336.1 ABC-2 family transporter protein [Actinoalloteichus hoggarensis]MBB5923244.1 hypothetical protein [Actinoalloteichus hoggarensis]